MKNVNGTQYTAPSRYPTHCETEKSNTKKGNTKHAWGSTKHSWDGEYDDDVNVSTRLAD